MLGIKNTLRTFSCANEGQEHKKFTNGSGVLKTFVISTLGSLFLIGQGNAATVNWSWTNFAGYSAVGSFTHSETTGTVNLSSTTNRTTTISAPGGAILMAIDFEAGTGTDGAGNVNTIEQDFTSAIYDIDNTRYTFANPTPYDIETPWIQLAKIGNDFYGLRYYSLGEEWQLYTSDPISSQKGFTDPVITVTPVPVPAAVWFLGSGLLGFIGIRYRQRDSKVNPTT